MPAKGHKWSLESRAKLSSTRRRLIASGAIRNLNRKIVVSVPQIAVDYGHWLAGFVDGDGCFGASRRPDGRIELKFVVQLRADDAEVLLEMRRVLGFGHVTYANSRKTKTVQFAVSAYAECAVVAAMFRRFPLRSKKRLDFAAWASIVDKCQTTYRPNYADFSAELEIMDRVKRWDGKFEGR